MSNEVNAFLKKMPNIFVVFGINFFATIAAELTC